MLKRKQILASLLAAAITLSFLAAPVLAVGNGNIDGGNGSGGSESGGGMSSGTKQNYWNNEDGCRITVLKDGNQVYQMDWSNQPESSVKMSFVKCSKLNYLHGHELERASNPYKSTVVAVKMPTIVGGSGGTNIKAIKRYFTDEYIIRLLSNGTGIPYDQLTGGEYKLLLESIAYFTYKGTKYAMTATEAAKSMTYYRMASSGLG